MTRKEKVYKIIREYTMGLAKEDLVGHMRLGLDATAVGKALGILRNNASKELALLARENKLLRIRGKPVLYLDREVLELKLGRPLTLQEKQTGTLCNKPGQIMNCQITAKCFNSLDTIIGGRGSLKGQVEQAKAAILYPPKGLHVFIFGPTGVGKTMFAERMHAFAIETGSIKPEAPFCIFNCADYAENPQLLLSQLFGYTKGAFTGAEKDKAGLVERANQGILLLDEVHRLPAEGQEMLFHLLDKGTYRRLGETEAVRQANVQIIAATTEDPDSYLLKTFIRRIPVVIQIPTLAERPLEERLKLIKRFLRQEAANIRAPIYITPEVLHGLLLYKCPGNVGQLKADIQLICARAFLSFTTGKQDKLILKYKLLPAPIKETLLVENYRKNLENLSINPGMYLKIEPEVQGITAEVFTALKEYYENLERGLRRSVIQNLKREAYNRSLSEIFTKSFEKFLGQSDLQDEEIGSFEEEDLYELLADVWHGLPEDRYRKRAMLIYYLHLNYKQRQNVSTRKLLPSLSSVKLEGKLLDKAAAVNGMLEEELRISLEHWDDVFLGCLLNSLAYGDYTNENLIGILVLAHGQAQATSMLEIANCFLGTNHGRALDMPWGSLLEDVLEQACSMVQAINQGKGVLLLVDMGSFLAFSEIITKKTGVLTRMVEGVNTSLVIQALGKVLQPGMTLDRLVRELEAINPYAHGLELRLQGKSSRPAYILVSCITGHGTAMKLANLLGTLEEIRERNIEVVAVNRYEERWEAYENIIAVVGTVDLKLPGVPFISVEEILTGSGLAKIFRTATRLEKGLEIPLDQGFEEVIASALERFLEFANPLKIYRVLDLAFKSIEEKTGQTFTPNLYLRFMIHCGCMIERLLRNSSLKHNKHNNILKNNEQLAAYIAQSFQIVEESFSIRIPREEYAYIIELVLEN